MTQQEAYAALRDAVAAAMADGDLGKGAWQSMATLSLHSQGEAERNVWRHRADAALVVVKAALAEPTRVACDAGWGTKRGEMPMTPRDVWLQMLAASPLADAPDA